MPCPAFVALSQTRSCLLGKGRGLNCVKHPTDIERLHGNQISSAIR